MRQTHAAGERLFVDYAGDGVPVVIDRLTGEIRMAQIFVAVLGASSFTFAKATWTQALPDWIDTHVRAFEAIGGVPELVVPDNAKTAIVKASFYEPEVNRTYAEMAAHYGTAILPARPRKPRDKAKVEQAVLIVERWPLGRLSPPDLLPSRRRRRRARRTHDPAQLEAGPAGGSASPAASCSKRSTARRSRSPASRREYQPRVRRVGVDDHVDIDAHYYSVPYRFARAEVEARLTARGVEIFHKGERIAVHLRASGNRKHTTVSEHMPLSHRRYAGWTIERIREFATNADNWLLDGASPSCASTNAAVSSRVSAASAIDRTSAVAASAWRTAWPGGAGATSRGWTRRPGRAACAGSYARSDITNAWVAGSAQWRSSSASRTTPARRGPAQGRRLSTR